MYAWFITYQMVLCGGLRLYVYWFNWSFLTGDKTCQFGERKWTSPKWLLKKGKYVNCHWGITHVSTLVSICWCEKLVTTICFRLASSLTGTSLGLFLPCSILLCYPGCVVWTCVSVNSSCIMYHVSSFMTITEGSLWMFTCWPCCL